MSQPLVSDTFWVVVAPLLPPAPLKPRGGRLRVPDRACLTGIIFVRKAGLPW
ncbi:MAG: transposase [Thermomicrobiales bacterium]